MAKVEEIVITCVGCPLGCQVQLVLDNSGEVTTVTGNKCKEGKDYAIAEYKHPVRVLTATVLTGNSKHPLLAVRTNKPINKGMLREAMYEIAKVRVKPPVEYHQVLIPNILDTGADIISSSKLVD